jgi:hypothetical protein
VSDALRTDDEDRTLTAERSDTAPPSVPYGAWPSPLSVDLAVASARTLREPRFDGDRLYWLEGRPTEGGRTVVMTVDAEGTASAVTPDGFDARTRVHEDGGGAYAGVDLALIHS